MIITWGITKDDPLYMKKLRGSYLTKKLTSTTNSN